VTIVVAASVAVLLAVTIPRALSPGNSATDENSAATNSQPITSVSPIDEPPIDEATLFSEYQQVRGKISQVHHDWSTSPPSQNSWESTIPELRAQLENLTEQIDQSGP
jgi:hypothetical protein